jgi:hypothetical protein
MRDWAKVLYWAAAGGLVGLGMIAILSIGILFLLAGVAMLVLGLLKVGTRGAWATVVGFGGVPSLLFLVDVASVFFVGDPSCSGIVWGNSSSGSITLSPGEESITCNEVPGSYLVLFGVFSAIALSGLGWRFFRGSPA